ncbi:hypothetical protein [Kitasatospora sp. NPDC059817]|uniref:hypothetical protein n=1 Tax=Kitasatospora sp. NPDC059817 TaxID=3346961 RepID=UPI00366312FA
MTDNAMTRDPVDPRDSVDPREFADRTVLITGGTSGMGLATARRLLAAGDRLLAVQAVAG